MKNEERLSKLREEEHQGILGVTKRTFEEMLKVLEGDYGQKHKKGGSPPKVSVLDKLIIMLQYYREYRAMRHIAFDYGVVKSTVSNAVAWAERTLIKSGLFRLPSKRKLLETDSPIEAAIVDAAECEIERPEKTAKLLLWKKEKAHFQIAYHSRRTDAGCHLHFNSSREKACFYPAEG